MVSSSPTVEHLARRVVRGVEQDQAGAGAHRLAQLVGIEGVAAGRLRPQQHRDRPGPGQGDARLVAVVHRLEDDDLVAVVEHPEQRSGERLRRPGGDQHLGVGVVGEAVEALLVAGDRLAQDGESGARRVLVDAGPDRVDGGFEHLRRAVGVGEPLTEVDRAGGDRQRRHLGEDRGAEPGQLRRQRAADRLARHGRHGRASGPADREAIGLAEDQSRRGGPRRRRDGGRAAGRARR